MDLPQAFFFLNAAMLWAFVLASAQPAFSQTEAGRVRCVKREADLKPPRIALPSNGTYSPYQVQCLCKSCVQTGLTRSAL
jgi:hypothetical protein